MHWSKKCFLATCSSTVNDATIKLYIFPANRQRLAQWLAAIGFTSAPPPGRFYRKLCSLHFEEKYKTPHGLCSNAIPTLLLPQLKSACSPEITPTLQDHNYVFREKSPPKRKGKMWCDSDKDDNRNGKGLPHHFNGHQKLKSRRQKSIRPAHCIETDIASAHNDLAKVSWPSTLFDYEACVNSPASVKLESSETAAEEWYHETAPRVCRVCLRVSDDEADMAPLLHHEMRTPLAHTMQHLIPDVQISPDDALPKQLCGACADDAARAERFVRQARRAQRRLAGLDPAAVADDVYQSSLLSRYLPSNATALDLDDLDDETFVSLRFDGDHLELETGLENGVKGEECSDEETCVAEATYSTDQNSGTTEAFEKFEESGNPCEEYVVHYFEDAPSLESYNNNVELLTEPPTKRRSRKYLDSPLSTGVRVTRNADCGQYPELTSRPLKRQHRQSHALSTRRLCEPAEYDKSFAPSRRLYDSLDANVAGHVRVKQEQRCYPVLACAHCNYRTRLKSKLRQHMRARHDPRRAPRLRPRGTRRAQS